MKKIELSNGMSVKVDDSLFEELSKYRWHFSNSGYAFRNVYMGKNKCKAFYMHWAVIGKPDFGIQVDHINRDRLDNRIDNLRHCTASENQRNTGFRRNNTSGVKGVTFNKNAKKWQVAKNGKYLGIYKDFEEAKKVAENS